MYDFIQGTLKASHPTHIVLENNGIGYHIYTPMSLFHTMPALEESLTLYTHFVVREDSMRLFGFLTEAERYLFIMLSDVSGIGPKTALSIIGHMNVEKLGQAVNNADVKALSSIPGIGKKTAERLVLELKDKLSSFASFGLPSLSELEAPISGVEQDAQNALISLGYKKGAAEATIKKIMKEHQTKELSLSEILKCALQAK